MPNVDRPNLDPKQTSEHVLAFELLLHQKTKADHFLCARPISTSLDTPRSCCWVGRLGSFCSMIHCTLQRLWFSRCVWFSVPLLFVFSCLPLVQMQHKDSPTKNKPAKNEKKHTQQLEMNPSIRQWQSRKFTNKFVPLPNSAVKNVSMVDESRHSICTRQEQGTC